jgi:curved DNA-binding protein CbpA
MGARTRFDKDYYGVMRLAPAATEDEIRKAYRRLALEWHPDRNRGRRDAEERFKEISEAYAVLVDPAKRREYDTARRAGASAPFQHSREDIFRDLFANPRASDIFEELAREFERLGVRVDRQYFHRTLFGGQTVVTGGVFVVTPLATLQGLLRLAGIARGRQRAGTPASARAEPRRALPSGVLGGIRRIGRWLRSLPAGSRGAEPGAPGAWDVTVPLRLSPAEARRGGQKRLTFTRNNRPQELLVTVPSGVQPGTRLRLRGQGRTGPDGSRGDLYLTVEIGDR